ncbi:hypothetical protein [Komarekiella delphini-convector]|nr:hypothetical protein [Komarekiella delphini-convector]
MSCNHNITAIEAVESSDICQAFITLLRVSRHGEELQCPMMAVVRHGDRN